MVSNYDVVHEKGVPLGHPFDKYCRTLCTTFAGCSSALPVILMRCKGSVFLSAVQVFFSEVLQFRIYRNTTI